jgi:hypothetical protein
MQDRQGSVDFSCPKQSHGEGVPSAVDLCGSRFELEVLASHVD